MNVLQKMFSFNSNMTDRDRIMLSPIEKWKRHGRFPFKLIFHATLLALVCTQVFVVVSQFTTYYRANNMIFQHFFLPEVEDPEDGESKLFSMDEVLDKISGTVETYYKIDNISLGQYGLDVDADGQVDPILLSLYTKGNLSDTDPGRVLDPIRFNLTDSDPLGPLDDIDGDERKLYFLKIVRIELRFSFDNNVGTQFVSNAPFRWVVTLSLDNQNSVFIAKIRINRSAIDKTMLFTLGWIPASILLVGSVSLFLGGKALVSAYAIFKVRPFASSESVYNLLRQKDSGFDPAPAQRTKMRWHNIPRDRILESYARLHLNIPTPITEWRDIPGAVKFDFFGGWFMFESVGEIFIIIATILGLFQDDSGMPISDSSRIMLGVGTIICFVNITKYLEYWKKFYTLVITLQGAAKRNMRFLVSVVPLFMGFLICGMIAFSPYSERFSSMDKAAVALFALLNGDDVHATFIELYSHYPYPTFSHLYLFCFVILFITAILNIFIFIIEDAYRAAKDYINAEAERHSRQFKANESGDSQLLGIQEFDLPTLFDILDDVSSSMSQERAHKLMERTLKKNIIAGAAMGVSPNVGNLVGSFAGGSFAGSFSQSFLNPLLAAGGGASTNTAPTDMLLHDSDLESDDEQSTSMIPTAPRDTRIRMTPARPGQHGGSTEMYSTTPTAPRRRGSSGTSSSTAPSLDDPALAAIISQAQNDFLYDFELKMKAAQVEFAKKLTTDISKYYKDKNM